MPARLGDNVKISLRYMIRGSSIFSPILKAGVGATGVIKRLGISITL